METTEHNAVKIHISGIEEDPVITCLRQRVPSDRDLLDRLLSSSG